MGTSYHQFCPVAKAMELLDERWTLLIVRELVAGSERFNELRRGVPRMSPTLLSKRLSQLVRAGVIERRGDDNDVDPKLLLWDMHRNVDYAAVPPGRTVVQFRFPDVPSASRDWWLVIGSAETDVCDDDPGHPVAVTVTGSLRRVTEVWRGDVSWPDALRSGGLTIQGPATLRRALPRWFTLSDFAPVARPA